MNFFKSIFLALELLTKITLLKIKTFKLVPITAVLFITLFSANVFSTEEFCGPVFSVDFLIEKERLGEREQVELSAFANKGIVAAQLDLGRNYLEGNKGFPVDFAEAEKWLKEASESKQADPQDSIEEQAEAQYLLGTMYLDGNGVEKDEAKAVKWFTLSYKSGNPNARYPLQIMIENGSEVALSAFKEIAESDAKAQYSLGRIYREGKGVAKDEEKAVKSFTLAHKKGHPNALYELQIMIENGSKKALSTIQEMAKYDAKAQHFLGLLHLDGTEVAKDEEEAVKLFILSYEENKNSDARNTLQEMIENGSEVALSAFKEVVIRGLKEASEVIKVLGEVAKSEDAEVSQKVLSTFKEVVLSGSSKEASEAIKVLGEVAKYGHSKETRQKALTELEEVITYGFSKEVGEALKVFEELAENEEADIREKALEVIKKYN